MEGGGIFEEIFESIQYLIKELWPMLLAILIGYFAIKYGRTQDILALIGTVILGRVAWKMWIHYIRQDFISGIEYVLLEIIPPRDVERNPLAMELFISNALYHFSSKGGREEFWQGAVWFWFSLELVSIDGQVHFYIRTPSRIRGLIETQMYAQYPQAQVRVVEDYTLAVDKISPESKWMGWGCEFGLLKPEAYPIKTYIDFGLDKNPDEELKIDPISPVIELFGSLQKGEQAWLQIVVTPSKKTWKTKGSWFERHDWVEESKVEMFRLLRPYTSTRQSADEPEHYGTEVRTPKHLDKVVEKMNMKTNKLGFETGIRLMYIAPKELYDMSTRRNVRLIFRQYQNPDSNGFDRINSAQGDALGAGVLGLSKEQVMLLADRALHEYRERGFYHLPMRHNLFYYGGMFYPKHWIFTPYNVIAKMFFLPYFHHQTYVLNTEELATIWHFPGQILKVPTLTRIESKESSPPPNLPI